MLVCECHILSEMKDFKTDKKCNHIVTKLIKAIRGSPKRECISIEREQFNIMHTPLNI